jgi:Ser/Thr protein kinase RdoA (MazF antagonist)
MPNTRRNQNLIVHTTRGKKVVKRYRADWNPETIIFEHSILTRLAETGFPAPRLAATPAGETWVQIDGRHYCVFDFLAGRNYSGSFLLRPQRVRMMATSGATLAQLHRALQGFLPAGRHHLGFAGYSGERHRGVNWFSERTADLSQRSRHLEDQHLRSQADWLVERADAVLAEIARLDEELSRVDLTRLIIHGDYGLHNLLYLDLDHAIPVDFELARLDWRLSDVVSVVGKFRYVSQRYDMESITHFLRAYQREFPIPDEEWQWLPLVWKYYKLTKAVQYWISFFETNGPARKLFSARDEILQADWAQANFDPLSAYRGDAR